MFVCELVNLYWLFTEKLAIIHYIMSRTQSQLCKILMHNTSAKHGLREPEGDISFYFSFCSSYVSNANNKTPFYYEGGGHQI